MNDYLHSKASAEELAHRIRQWWLVKTGKVPKVWIEKQTLKFGEDRSLTRWDIRSDIKMSVNQRLTPSNTVG
jgi:hypothetical protein